MSRLLVVSTIALWVGATLLLSGLRWFRRPPLVTRLARFVPSGRAGHGRDLDTGGGAGLLSVESFREIMGPLARTAGERLARLMGVAEPLEVRLARIRSPLDATQFRLRQLTRSAAAGGLTLALAAASPLPAVVALGACLGAVLLTALVMEQQVLTATARRRQHLFAELPVVTEQLGMLLGAGFSLGGALARIGSRGDGLCAADLRAVGNRVRQGLSEVEALREWAELTGLDELDRLVAVLALNQATGDLGRLIAEEARTMRREAQRRTVELLERRAQMVWIPVTVATLVPGVLLMAVPFLGAMSAWSAL